MTAELVSVKVRILYSFFSLNVLLQTHCYVSPQFPWLSHLFLIRVLFFLLYPQVICDHCGKIQTVYTHKEKKTPNTTKHRWAVCLPALPHKDPTLQGGHTQTNSPQRRTPAVPSAGQGPRGTIWPAGVAQACGCPTGGLRGRGNVQEQRPGGRVGPGEGQPKRSTVLGHMVRLVRWLELREQC